MKKSYNKAFTLVELLAVIVILAIILVIAVPKIMDVINSSKKSTLETSVKMIASSAEKTKMQNTVLGKENEEIACGSVAKLSSNDYESCNISFDGNTAKVTVKGKGKFEGLYVCGGTKSQATAQTDECLDTLVTHIQELYQTSATDNGLIKDEYQNIRFSGGNDSVKNYVAFPSTTEQEIWRIIGIFEVETSSGVTEELVKLVKEESIGNLPWDYSDSSINNGWGINQWGESGDYEGADLMRYLNVKASYNDIFGNWVSPRPSSSVNNKIYATRLDAVNESSSGYYTINVSLSNMIENSWWNTGAIKWDNVRDSDNNLKRELLYNSERGELTGKSECESSGGSGCNDTVVRTTSWKGKIALPYASDWAYASTNDNCKINVDNYSCSQDNWMHNGGYTWMLSPLADPDYASIVSLFPSSDASNSVAVRPAIYLKSNVQINSGTGAQNDPYILKSEL